MPKGDIAEEFDTVKLVTTGAGLLGRTNWGGENVAVQQVH